jgi:hypothetical protein
MLFLIDGCSKHSYIVKKYSTDQNPKVKDSEVRDF